MLRARSSSTATSTHHGTKSSKLTNALSDKRINSRPKASSDAKKTTVVAKKKVVEPKGEKKKRATSVSRPRSAKSSASTKVIDSRPIHHRIGASTTATTKAGAATAPSSKPDPIPLMPISKVEQMRLAYEALGTEEQDSFLASIGAVRVSEFHYHSTQPVVPPPIVVPGAAAVSEEEPPIDVKAPFVKPHVPALLLPGVDAPSFALDQLMAGQAAPAVQPAVSREETSEEKDKETTTAEKEEEDEKEAELDEAVAAMNQDLPSAPTASVSLDEEDSVGIDWARSLAVHHRETASEKATGTENLNTEDFLARVDQVLLSHTPRDDSVPRPLGIPMQPTPATPQEATEEHGVEMGQYDEALPVAAMPGPHLPRALATGPSQSDPLMRHAPASPAPPPSTSLAAAPAVASVDPSLLDDPMRNSLESLAELEKMLEAQHQQLVAKGYISADGSATFRRKHGVEVEAEPEPKANPTFDEIDTNGDGVIDRKEYQAAQPAPAIPVRHFDMRHEEPPAANAESPGLLVLSPFTPGGSPSTGLC